jgi:hypothetical protein
MPKRRLLRKKLIAPVCVIAFTVCGTVSALAYTLNGTGYVITNETVSVIVPSTLDFTLDPLEINGLGTVFSEEYPLVNMGATDVILTFTDIKVIFGNDTDFVMSDVPVSPDEIGGPKKVYLVLDFGNPDIEPIVLTDPYRAAPPEIILRADFKEDAEYSLGVTGSISSYPENDWGTGDVAISLTYHLNSATPDEPAQPETPAQSENPAQPQEPTQPDTPAQTEEPAQSDKPTEASEETELPPAGPPGAEEPNPILNEEEDAENVIGE